CDAATNTFRQTMPVSGVSASDRSVPAFFRSDGLPPYLHSFPTRRSSDLECFARRALLAVEPGKTLLARGHIRELAPRPLAVRDEDRKSTRLNSSHRTSSYAVFCLKKKNPEKCRAASRGACVRRYTGIHC